MGEIAIPARPSPHRPPLSEPWRVSERTRTRPFGTENRGCGPKKALAEAGEETAVRTSEGWFQAREGCFRYGTGGFSPGRPARSASLPRIWLAPQEREHRTGALS